jgi:CubicO group peptidase (beta-lactamase class C family)
MKTIACVILSLAVSLSSFAQTDAYEKFVIRFVEHYNSKHFDQVYALTAPGFQQKVTQEAFVSILQSIHQTTGKFKQHRLGKDEGAKKIYYLIGEKQSHALTMVLDENGQASGLLIRPEILPASSEEESMKRVTLLLDEWKKDAKSKALVIGIFDRGVYSVFYQGTVIKDQTIAPRENTLFEIGSISKPLTGLILQSMILEGKLKLSDPVNNYLPADAHIPNVRQMPVRIQHLITHTSCLPRLPGDLMSTMKGFDNPYKNYTPDHLLKYLPTLQIDCDLGKKSEYSNLAAGLLGFILTRISGKTYAELVQHYLVGPLGLSGFGVLERTDAWATGYNPYDQPQVNWDFTDALVGAGGLDASAEGMKKLLSFLTNPDQSLLGKAVNASVETQWKQEQELGTFWVNQTLGNKVVHWHNGQTGGFNAFLGWVEGHTSGVFILSNQSGDVATRLGMAYLEGMGSR